MRCGGRGSVGRALESQGRLRSVSEQPARQTNGAKARRRLLAKTGGCVRQNRVVLAPVAGAKSAEVLRVRLGAQNLNPPMTVTRRIRRRGEHGISRKTIAQGRRDAPTVPVCSCAFSMCIFARETAGAASTRL